MKRMVLNIAVLGLLLAPFAFLSAQEDVSELVAIDDSPLNRSLAGGVVSYAETLKEVRPSVVSVYSKSSGNELSREELLMEQIFGMRPDRRDVPMVGLGSGVIVSENGYILTNYHVVSEADEIQVKLDSKRIYDAELIGVDPGTDIAVIKIAESGLPRATLGDSDRIQVGDVVFAIGNPLGVGKTVTMGIVSATQRQEMRIIENGFEDFIQTDAPINSGNSGGALVDAKGRLIGINTLIQTDGFSHGSIGIGFAVPVNLVYSVMRDLIQDGNVRRGFLGVGIEPLDQDTADYFGAESLRGALVNQVTLASPAEAAGIEIGDLILEVDGEQVDSPADLRIMISQKKPGSEISILLLREKEQLTVLATLGQLGGELVAAAPDEASPEPEISVDGFLEGVGIQSLDTDLRSEHSIDESIEGVVITEVDPASPYADRLPVGMVILKLNGKAVGSVEEAESLLIREGKNMLLVAYRGVYRFVPITIE